MNCSYKPKRLPTREMKPLSDEQRRDYQEYIKKYGQPQEEPLPVGASLSSRRVMNSVFESMVLSGVIS